MANFEVFFVENKKRHTDEQGNRQRKGQKDREQKLYGPSLSIKEKKKKKREIEVFKRDPKYMLSFIRKSGKRLKITNHYFCLAVRAYKTRCVYETLMPPKLPFFE